MGAVTGIEWTDATWNPIRGCSRISEGCRNCYAERVAGRFSGDFYNIESKGDLAPFYGFAKLTASGPRWTGKVEIVEKHLGDPLRWKKPRRIFVNSMSDLFHEALPDEAIDEVFAVMAICPQHTFQILTKRPERMLKWSAREWSAPVAGTCIEVEIGINDRGCQVWSHSHMADPFTDAEAWPLPNVWLGVSVEDQATADERIPLLLQTPAAKRYVSYEPALGPVDLTRLRPALCTGWVDSLGKREHRGPAVFDAAGGLDWVICGGESGPSARPMNPAWARLVRDQCREALVPFFFKQNGEFASVSEVAGPGIHHHFPTGETVRRVGKKAAGATLDGREYKEFPQ
jgi:protein gp37